MLSRYGLILGALAALPADRAEACLNGLGPNWEDLKATESVPVLAVIEVLKKHGKNGGGGEEKWYEDEEGRVVYCTHGNGIWNSFLFELSDGEWKLVNEVRTVL